MEEQSFDVIVIGAGPGGYVAAIRAAQNGAKVALIEKNALGGSCLNVGCIPTKTLLSNAAVLHSIKKAKEFGIVVPSYEVHYEEMKKRKDAVIKNIRQSLQGLLQSNKITIFTGTAQFASPYKIKVTGEEGVAEGLKGGAFLTGKKIIIATGSQPMDIAAFPCDHKKILNSSSILELTQLPKSLAIIGGGYIGCEFASLFHELGVNVTIIEALPAIVMAQGKAVSEALTKAFEKKGIPIWTQVLVEGIETEGNGVRIRLKDKEPFCADLALVSVGRKIWTDDLALSQAGLSTIASGPMRGAIPVNDKMETEVPGIYAIGDVTGQFLLAHVASHQAIVAADQATGKNPSARMHYNAVPAVIFTDPEIACVGLTLEQAQERGFKTAIGKFPFQALGKSIAAIETEGFAEVILDKTTGQILGAQVVGYGASSLIAEMALAIANELTAECVIDTIHAHPTIAEGWLEATLIAHETPIHFPPKIKK